MVGWAARGRAAFDSTHSVCGSSAVVATLSEADVLFELFLPVLCQGRARALQSFKGVIEFRLTGADPRAWTLRGGDGPWVTRGAPEGGGDVRISVTPEIVAALVQGREPNMDAAVAAGEVRFDGDLKVLDGFGMMMGEVAGVLGRMLRR